MPALHSVDNPAFFEILAEDGTARRGRIQTPHGVIETPAFMPVATFGAVRGISPGELLGAGAQMLLANTFHLHERPGEAVIAAQGGLHGFTGWRGPWLTDSGGFQVTSMADRLVVEEQGVTITSPLDGRRRLLTPESVVSIQAALGSDIAMVLDECQPPDADVDGTGGATLRKVNPRYLGIDKENQAFSITADLARRPAEGSPAVELEMPKADITLDDGTWLVLTAHNGVYKQIKKTLELTGAVNMFHDSGYEFKTSKVSIDLEKGLAEGDAAVRGQGPFGDLRGEGFRLIDKGKTIVFTGKSKLVIYRGLGNSVK